MTAALGKSINLGATFCIEVAPTWKAADEGLPPTALDYAAALRERTRKFAIRIVKLCDSLPSGDTARTIRRQLLRSGTSVAANYRAVCRARSKPEFLAKMGVVVEEADETAFWLEFLVDVGLVPTRRMQPLLNEANELLAIFAGSLRTARTSVLPAQ